MLQSFFSPKSVAVIGASREKGKVGNAVFENMLNAGYEGGLYPVNPKAPDICGRPCYASVSALPETPELAVIVVPNKFVIPAVDELGRKGTRAVVVITAGFKEAGIEGKQLETELVNTAKRHGIRIVGPNCLGILDTGARVNASFARLMANKGEIAFLSQSGALCTAILDWSVDVGIGFSKFISFGNKSDVNEIELIEYFGNDPGTKVIGAYLEGVSDGRKFMDTVHRVSLKKPVIIYKSGGTSAGAKAVSSHTGTLAGSESAYMAAFQQCHAIHARTVESLFALARGFSYQALPKGDRVGIITNAGGPGIITADNCERMGLKLSSLSQKTTMLLQEKLPPSANFHNPVDVLGDALADRYGLATQALLDDDNVDAILFILTPQAMTEIDGTADLLAVTFKNPSKPIFTIFMGKHDVEKATCRLNDSRIPNYTFPETAVETLAAMVRHKRAIAQVPAVPKRFEVDSETVKGLLGKLRDQGRRQAGESSRSARCSRPTASRRRIRNSPPAPRRRRRSPPRSAYQSSSSSLRRTYCTSPTLAASRSACAAPRRSPGLTRRS
jgi:acetyl coenzyme A synthetase (ADP forming)-like protein